MASHAQSLTPPIKPAAAAPDALTVAAIAIVAYALASVLHEGVGHGGACVMTGGHPLVLSTVHFECDKDNRIIDAGGTVVNLVAGFIFLMLSRLVSRSAHLRYFLWLLMTINLLQGGGYFLFSGFGNIGDWAAVIQGLRPAWLWRVLLIVVGTTSYYLFVWIAAREMRVFLGGPGASRMQVARRLTLIPYFTGGILSCVAGALNPVGMILVAISAAAASFGGTSGLVWMSQLVRRENAVSTTDAPLPVLTRSRGWIAAAVIVGALFIGFLGPALFFGNRAGH